MNNVTVFGVVVVIGVGVVGRAGFTVSVMSVPVVLVGIAVVAAVVDGHCSVMLR